MKEEYRKYMRNVKELDEMYEKEYGVKGIYTKQMESQIAIKEEYGVVEIILNATTAGTEETMIIKTQSGLEIFPRHKKRFNRGEEVVYVTYLFNRPATKDEIECFEFFYRVEGVKFLPDYPCVTYYARDYEQMKKNGGPKR